MSKLWDAFAVNVDGGLDYETAAQRVHIPSCLLVLLFCKVDANTNKDDTNASDDPENNENDEDNEEDEDDFVRAARECNPSMLLS